MSKLTMLIFHRRIVQGSLTIVLQFVLKAWCVYLKSFQRRKTVRLTMHLLCTQAGNLGNNELCWLPETIIRA
uniref:Putative secreted protein n=1 Tax=Anopheles triannulatus TaxID=58253 RepID=A0A2M4B7C5_9DIPT